MRICFNIHFYTQWGQRLYITGAIPELGSWNHEAAIAMQYKEAGFWSIEMDISESDTPFEYRYFLKSDDRIVVEEWHKNHSFLFNKDHNSYYLLDYWQNPPKFQAFYSSAFTQSLFAHASARLREKRDAIVLKVWAPLVPKGQSVVAFGSWDNWTTPLPLCPENFPEWRLQLSPAGLREIEYKFCLIDSYGERSWEEGENRHLVVPETDSKRIISGLQFRERATDWKCAGVSIPVFSLRSNSSFGIGEFPDLIKLIDWAEASGQKLIQILPVNDTTMTRTWQDSYPYNAISIYALQPLYLNLEQTGLLRSAERQSYYREKQNELNALPFLDYEKVSEYKWEYLRELFIQQGEETTGSEQFKQFYSDNKSWLIPYAAYSTLRDTFKCPDFHLWNDYARYDRNKITKLYETYPEVFQFYFFLQYHLHLQLSEVADYAHKKGVILKGDIPIGVSNNSVDAWRNPEYFKLDFQAGAPPDDFSANGQNWGFPTYNWETMEADDYLWWRNRFDQMANYFDAYRIDHILGFFRIWQIPNESKEGLLGYFYPSLPFSLEEIKASGMVFRKEFYTKASIHEKYLPELFGDYTPEVCQVYLNRINASHFELKEEVNTQLKIQEYFDNRPGDKNRQIKEGLFSVCNQVLFIEDKERSNYFHPRISASTSYCYRELDNQNRNAFDYLYWDYYYNRQNEFWKEIALKHLTPLVKSTEMLSCGEDLGMIPNTVPEVMNQLQILSLELERMPKSPQDEFTSLKQLPYLSVCTTSTHDMNTLRGWWKEDREKIQRYYNRVLNREGEAPEDCTPAICQQIISNHLASSSLFCILPLQDWLSIDERMRNPDIASERINVPANSRHYWRYRMHLSLEELLEADEFNKKIKALIQDHRNT